MKDGAAPKAALSQSVWNILDSFDFEEPVGGDDKEPEAVLGAEDKVAPVAVEVLAKEVEGDTLEDLLPF